MSSLWSNTKAAVNKGWGMKTHPEFLMRGPYGTVPTVYASRGGKRFKKGSAAAKKYMAKLRAMRGRGYTNAALEGCGYTDAALEGCGYTDAALDGYGYNDAALAGGGTDAFSILTEGLSDTTMKTIETLAKQLNTSAQALLSDPDRLMAIAKKYAPSVANAIKKVYSIFSHRNDPDPNAQRKEEIRKYMQWLKQSDPDRYREIYQKMQKDAWEQYNQQKQALFLHDKISD